MNPIWLFKCVGHSALYDARYRKYLKKNADQPVVFVHPPKTAGTSIAKVLGIIGPGHFPLVRHLQSRRVSVERCIMSTRDPVTRLQSTFRYARMPSHSTPLSPVKFLREYDYLEEFVLSENFSIAVKYHYFFKAQSFFLRGLDSLNCELSVVRQEAFESDMKRLGYVDVPSSNISPDMQSVEATALSSEARGKISDLYESDYRLIARFERECPAINTGVRS